MALAWSSCNLEDIWFLKIAAYYCIFLPNVILEEL